MQSLNFASKKNLFLRSIYLRILFLQGFLQLLINCYNSKRSNFSFIMVYLFTSAVLTFFTSTYCTDPGCENPFIYFKNWFSFVFSKPITSEYANKFRIKGILSGNTLKRKHSLHPVQLEQRPVCTQYRVETTRIQVP